MTRRPDDDDKLLKFSRRRKSDPQRIKEYGDLARWLQQERRSGRDLVDRLLQTTPRERWPALSEHRDLQTVGAIETLGNTINATLATDPIKAMALAELAVAAAEAMSDGAYPRPTVPQLRAHAWKDYGKALRFLGRNEEALEAFDRAEERAEPYGALGHDLALVRFHRVMSLQELGRFEESQTLLADCKEVFESFGDMRNAILCGLAEGTLLQRLRRYREAREAYLLLFTSGKDVDAETRAALHRVIGLCSIELGDFHVAERNLLQGIALHTTLGQPLEVLKSETAFGRLLLRRGDTGAGIDHLRPLRRQFLGHGLVEEAGICGLEMVEGLLVLGETSAAEKLARQIVFEYTTAGLSARAIGAVGYLTEAITAKRASATLVTDVREYIVSLRTSPERDFVTPS